MIQRQTSGVKRNANEFSNKPPTENIGPNETKNGKKETRLIGGLLKTQAGILTRKINVTLTATSPARPSS